MYIYEKRPRKEPYLLHKRPAYMKRDGYTQKRNLEKRSINAKRDLCI